MRQPERYCTEHTKPPGGTDILFWYDDQWHIGYLTDDDGSNKPRKWTWISYMKDYQIIDDLVDYWAPIPSNPIE